jgi:threonyl-tRNA synthetase
MPTITLPDGSQRSFDHPVSVAEVAASIGAGLAKATVAGKVNGQLVDASDMIDADARLQIITPKDQEGLEIMRPPGRSRGQAAVPHGEDGHRSGHR